VKKFFAVLLSTILAILVLSGCSLSFIVPESIRIDNKTYKTGFYGTLYPNEFPLTEYTLQNTFFKLVRIDHDTFELYHAGIGPYPYGTIYCEESQYEQVSEYYNDPANYTYYCILGVDKTDGTCAQTVELPDVDTALFDDLLSFADQSGYDPFDSQHNSKVETVDLPMPDDDVDTRMVFYKESNDGLFCSEIGVDYYIIDNSLYRVFVYDYGHGEYEKLVAVEVPKYISDYFVSYMEPYLNKGL
jgi:hypothetical protein